MTKLDAGLITSLPASDPGSAAVWGSKRINPRPQSCLCLTWSGYLFKRRRRRRAKDNVKFNQKCYFVQYNAAIVREPHNKNYIYKDLQSLCSRLLNEANATQKDADLIAKLQEVKQKLEKMRNEVDKKLNKLKESDKNNGTQKVPKYQMGNAKISAIRNLQEVSAEYTKIMAELSKYCETVMGYPPCKFSVVGMARKEITPYSDFEHTRIIVLENDTKTRLDYKRILNYFRWFTVIFHVVVINLQETICYETITRNIA